MKGKILITGALGHIGSEFIHNIKKDEYEEVVLLDNLSTQRYVSLFNLPSEVNYRFLEEDIYKANLEKYFQGIDVVIHLAAITNAAGSFEIQDEVEKVNYEGTKRVAEACLKSGSKLIFLSTTSVYGTQDEVVDENCSEENLKPQSPYADSKLRSEKFLALMGEKGLKYVSFRFGTIFGTSVGMRFHTAVNKFCWQAIMGKPITVWRTAMKQKRPYLDLKDAIKALKFVVEKDIFNNEIYNVLTVNATVKEIVNFIRNDVPELKVELVDTLIMNQLSYTVSCDKFCSLGFVFEGNISKSIAGTLRLLRNANKAG
jgi:UDP-glucose 4-epimerase